MLLLSISFEDKTLMTLDSHMTYESMKKEKTGVINMLSSVSVLFSVTDSVS